MLQVRKIWETYSKERDKDLAGRNSGLLNVWKKLVILCG